MPLMALAWEEGFEPNLRWHLGILAPFGCRKDIEIAPRHVAELVDGHCLVIFVDNALRSLQYKAPFGIGLYLLHPDELVMVEAG